MNSRGLRTCLSIGLGFFVLALVFLAGAGVGYFANQLNQPEVTVSGPITCPPCPVTPANGEAAVAPIECPECPYVDAQGDTPEEYQNLFAPFWEVWDVIHKDYVDQPVDDLALMRGAIDGMLDALGDRHTSYLRPDEFRLWEESLTGEYGGIGAWVDITGDYVEIINPMPNSPALEAGLQPKDIIIGIDGDDMTGVDGDVVLSRIRGIPGTDVTLKVDRAGETFEVTITRELITIPTVEYEMLEDDLGYIALYSFDRNTTPQLRAAIQELLDEGMVGLVLDLRGNGGGLLNTAIQVVSEFIGEGVVMYEQLGSGETFVFDAIPGGLATEIPLVVLVNEGSASASEITAGAIQDLERAPLVGALTFGKGSVQNWVELQNNAGGLRVTIARWLTPNGRQISGAGLEPDYVVEITEDDFAEGRDPQLDKAIEVLLDSLQN